MVISERKRIFNEKLIGCFQASSVFLCFEVLNKVIPLILDSVSISDYILLYEVPSELMSSLIV